jgi:hypothetical protein
MGTARLLPTIAALLALACAPAHADAPPSATIAPLDARHVVILRGDRMVVYEIDPARKHQARVVNTVILDEEGQIVGQFRPDPAAAPVVPMRPIDPPKAAPRPEPDAAGGALLHARRAKPAGLQARKGKRLPMALSRIARVGRDTPSRRALRAP